MTKDLVLAIDQGTTGTTVMAMNARHEVVAKENREFRQIYPKAGWVEHDLEDIWASTEQTLASVLAHDDVAPERIAAIGITNQRETVGVWDRKTGAPIDHAIVWQCRRTADRTAALKAAGHEAEVRRRTGLLLDPYFSATKFAWLLDHVDARAKAKAGDLAAGTIDSFLVWRLTGGKVHVTDMSNACRTLLFDLEAQTWSDDLLDLFDVPRAMLPEIRSSAEVYGTTKGVAGLPDGIPIAGIAGDQQAALFGQACFAEGDAKCTYGTGAFLNVNTGETIRRSEHGMLSSVAWQLGPDAPVQYMVEGSVFVAGAAVQWLRDGLGLISSAAEVEELAKRVADSGEVVFVPALTGLGAPHWRPDARGIIRGITRDTTRAHLARATLEGIALQCTEVLEALRKDSGALEALRVDGGAAANDLLMQTQADLLEQEVIRPVMLETTAAGAAFLAGLGAGLFEGLDVIRSAWREDRRFTPAPTDATRRLRDKWAAATERA